MPMPGGGGASKQKGTFEDFTAALLLTGLVKDVKYGPTALSMPPIHSATITFTDLKMIRGTKPDQPVFSYRARQVKKPVFPAGVKMIVAGHRDSRGRLIADVIVPADAGKLALAEKAAKVGIGWSMKGGKILSPFAALGANAWPKGLAIEGAKDAPVCSKTGRPALLCGEGVAMKSEQVPPPVKKKWQNTYGDGKFKITLTNTGKQPVTIPALLQDKDKILWDDCLVLMVAKKPYLLGGAGKVTASAKPVTIKAGESITTEINTLTIKGIKWPRGGSRVYFQFCLGEVSSSNFFYYYSKHHDTLLPK
jgi:hypothetical protein